jgi:hypothetical protein
VRRLTLHSDQVLDRRERRHPRAFDEKLARQRRSVERA